MICFSQYPKEKDFNFNITAKEMLKLITPPVGAESYHPLFKKYGYMVCGISECWLWNDMDIPDEDIWHMAAIANLYWLNFYEHLNNKEEFEKYKQYVKESIEKEPRFQQTLDKLEKSQAEAEQERLGAYIIRDGQKIKL